MSSSAEKRCLYEVLGLSRDCTSDEIRSAYKRQALRCHPDKLMQSGVSPDVATAAFQELVNAHEVLSDPKERSWYDSHRSQIIFSNSHTKSSKGSVPDLFSFFTNSVFTGYSDTGKGFYKVYADVFDKIYANEINFATRLGLNPSIVEKAPSMGNLKSYYEQASAFYAYWLGFVTVMDFCWEDEYDVMAGLNRKSRRVMEDENNKRRKKARREYNDTVRGLAAFVKKRDKRVIDMLVKKKEMMEKKRVEEMLKKKELERQKMERAMAYKASKWAEVEEEEEEEYEVEIEDEKNVNVRELYCVACGKRFKSDKQWKNHEQSKKHKEKIAELKEAFSKEDIEMGEEEEEDDDDIVEELQEQFEEHVSLEEKQSDEEVFVGADDGSSAEEVFVGADDGSSDEEVFVGADDGSSDSKGIDDEEDSFLEAMISGHKKSKATANLEKEEEEEEEGDDDEEDSFLDAMISGHKKSKAASASLEKEEKSKAAEAQSIEEERFVDADNGDTLAKSDDDEEEEDSFLEAMISGHMKKKNVHKSQANSYPDAEVEKPKHEEEEADFMEYNNTKSNRRTRRKDRSNKTVKEGIIIPDQVKLPVEEKASSHIEEDNNGTTEDQPAKNQKPTKQPVLKKKGKAKKDSNNPLQPQGRKQNASSKPTSTSSVCATCGEDFGSKTKLHKHLNDSGHATLKHR